MYAYIMLLLVAHVADPGVVGTIGREVLPLMSPFLGCLAWKPPSQQSQVCIALFVVVVIVV